VEAGIVIDNGIDLPKEFIEKENVKVVKGVLRFDDEDVSHLSFDELLKEIEKRNSLPMPAVPPPSRFLEAYHELEKNYEVIFSFHTTRNMTGMINSARAASQMYEGKSKILVVDSGTATIAAGIVIMKIIEKLRNGMEISKVGEEVSKLSKKVHLIFFLKELSSLTRIRPVEGIKKIMERRISPIEVLKLLRKGEGYLLTLREGKISILSKIKSGSDISSTFVERVKKLVEKRIDLALSGYLVENKIFEEVVFSLEREFSFEFQRVRLSPLVLSGAGPGLWGVSFLPFD